MRWLIGLDSIFSLIVSFFSIFYRGIRYMAVLVLVISNYSVISMTLSDLRCCMSFAFSDKSCPSALLPSSWTNWCNLLPWEMPTHQWAEQRTMFEWWKRSGLNIIMWLINCFGSWKLSNSQNTLIGPVGTPVLVPNTPHTALILYDTDSKGVGNIPQRFWSTLTW